MIEDWSQEIQELRRDVGKLQEDIDNILAAHGAFVGRTLTRLQNLERVAQNYMEVGVTE